MKKGWLILEASLMVVLLASGIGITEASFVDLETSSGNSFEAWTSTKWTQTTVDDFNSGVKTNVEVVSPGDVLLSLIPNPTLVTSDNSEVSIPGGMNWQLVKTLTFIKSGATYDELRIDSNLKKTTLLNTAYSSIRVDDMEKFSHSTTSTSYVIYQDILDFSSYSDGEHTVKLYLNASLLACPTYNSLFELYRTKTYASSGTIASQVRDTGNAGARWDALFWDETLESNTDITFEVRASDTSFVKNATSPDWISVEGTSPVTSGLPSGRYKQWRATLTTSDTSKTPTLHEVRVYHY
jgi:hypothetical protein